MSIDWTKPLVVAGTDRVATVVNADYEECTRTCFADWDGTGEGYLRKLGFDTPRLTNAPPTPKIGPEHIDALAEAIGDAEDQAADSKEIASFYGAGSSYIPKLHARAAAAEQRAARLAEIRAYLESL